MKRILLSTTSYQDTPGAHHALLESQDFEIVRARGPLDEDQMLALEGEFDGLLCGDDVLNRKVLDFLRPRLTVISKYGIGLDKIDVESCSEFGIPVLFTPGVNHTTVAEHAFGLMLSIVRNLPESINAVRAGEWKRLTGNELWRKTIAIIGLGRIGQEVAKRAIGFDMDVVAYDIFWPDEFASTHNIRKAGSAAEAVAGADVVSLHTNLSKDTHHLVNADLIAAMKKGALVINTSRGELVANNDIIAALDSGRLGAYATDVLDHEPPPADHPFLKHPKIIVTPHIGSRTYESVPRQAMRATKNLVNFFSGDEDVIQANKLKE